MDLLLIEEREKGQIPISIGTSLALEGAAGIHPDRPQQPPPFDTPPTQMWVNTRTLFRNMHGALSADARKEVMAPSLHIALIAELQAFEAAVIRLSEGRTNVVFYGCDYAALPRRYPKALLKQANTPNQRAYMALEQQTLKLLMKEHGAAEVRHFDLEFQGSYKDAWILSHLPVDLLNKNHFTSLKLLESHTGTVKAPALWYTKLTNGKDMPNMPFGPFSLQIFGDGGHQFQPMDRVIREAVLALAEKYQWNATTTKDRLIFSIKSIQDPMTRTFLLSLV